MSEEIAKKLLELGEEGIKLASGQITSITAELLNYFIFESILNITRQFALMLIPLLIFKLLGTLKSYYKTESEKNLNTLAVLGFLRGMTLVGCLIMILNVGLNDGKRIGKILIAPKVFLLEQARMFIKNK